MTLENKKKLDRLVGGLMLGILTPLFKRFSSKSKNVEDKLNILVIKLVGGGSLLNFLPTLVSLKKSKKYNYNISILCTKKVEPFARSLGVFDSIYSLDDRNPATLIISYFLFLLKFKKTQTVIDLEVHSRVTSILTMLSRSEVRIGFFVESVLWRQDIYTHLIFYNRYAGRSLILNKVADLYGIPLVSQGECQKQISQANLFKNEIKDYCVFAPCSSELAKRERQLGVQQWIYYLKKNLKINNFKKIVILSTFEDFIFCESLEHQLTKSFPDFEVINLAGKTSFREAISLTIKSNYFIGIDSSLVHFAHLFSKEGLCVWGPTSPKIVLNSDWSSQLLNSYIPVGCSPCIHIAEDPPCKGNNMCIKVHFDNYDKNFIPVLVVK